MARIPSISMDASKQIETWQVVVVLTIVGARFVLLCPTWNFLSNGGKNMGFNSWPLMSMGSLIKTPPH